MRHRVKGCNNIRSVLITAGPTREKIDPVRFISNYSTGTFGYSIAKEAVRRGWKTVLVSGPTSLEEPKGAKVIRVESAGDMRKAVRAEVKKVDCVIMAAAICDWKPKIAAKNKIKKEGHDLTLKLGKTPDILSELGKMKKTVLVGFALETEDLEKNAISKMKKKNLDMIIANRLNNINYIFGDNDTNILIIDKNGTINRFKGKSKQSLAKIILDKVSEFTI